MTGPLRARRSPVPAIVLAVIGLLVIGVAQGVPNRHSIEKALTSRSARALQAAGLPAEVSFTGRDGVVRVAPADADRARTIVRAQEGVRVVRVVTPVPTTSGPAASGPAASGPAASGPATPVAPSVILAVTGGSVVLSGVVSSEATRAAVVAAARSVYGQDAVEDRLVVRPGIGDIEVAGLGAILGSLGRDTPTATVELADTTITLTGTVGSVAVKDAAVDAARQVIGASGSVVDRLTVLDEAAAAARLRAQLAALPRITFETGSSRLTAPGRAAVRTAAAFLMAHPGPRFRVEGHTDGVGGRRSNIALSQHRAQKVIQELTSLGVPGDRLAFWGWGSDRPKVPGDSPASRAINRRVEFVAK